MSTQNYLLKPHVLSKVAFLLLMLACEMSTNSCQGQIVFDDTYQNDQNRCSSKSQLLEMINSFLGRKDTSELIYESDQDEDQFENNMSLERNQRFQQPPSFLLKELQKDKVDDHWENSSASYQPIIGILTQPTSDRIKAKGFKFRDYILEVNDNFIKWGGSRTLAIPYDISKEDLNKILPQINGFLFTGGALDLIDKDKNMHPYYANARRIIEYSKKMKDEFNETWPILGICQGLEVVSIYLGDDDIDTLDKIVIYGENRKVTWATLESTMFGGFPEYLKQKMQTTGLALHAHTYSVSVDTYLKKAGLRQEMKILQFDTWENEGKSIKFINAMEGRRYPFYTTMYHPEYQLLDLKWTPQKGDATDEIAFRLSLMLNRQARTNSNRVKPESEDLINKMALSRVSANPYPMIQDIVIYAYGYQRHPQTKH